MSSGFALLLLVVGSAATSSESFSDLMRMTKRTHLAMTMARSRQGQDDMLSRFLVNIVQNKWGKSAVQQKKPEKNNRFHEMPVIKVPNYWFKVCTKCPKHTWFLKKIHEPEATGAEAVRKAVIQQVVLQALERGLTSGPNN